MCSFESSFEEMRQEVQVSASCHQFVHRLFGLSSSVERILPLSIVGTMIPAVVLFTPCFLLEITLETCRERKMLLESLDARRQWHFSGLENLWERTILDPIRHRRPIWYTSTGRQCDCLCLCLPPKYSTSEPTRPSVAYTHERDEYILTWIVTTTIGFLLLLLLLLLLL
jgi:hypothetical protein